MEVFIVFCMASSIVYIFNDIKDFKSDQHNRWKKNRPIAKELISFKKAILIALIIFILLIFTVYFFKLNKLVILIISIYFLFNFLYTLIFKNIFIVNFIFLLSFFYLRLLAGTIENEIELSYWITIFILTSSLILILGKKLSDFNHLNKELKFKKKSVLKILFFVSILQLIIYLLFINTEYAALKYGDFFKFSIVFVALGTFRYLYLIKNQSVTSDQIVLFLKDKYLLLSSLGFLIYLYTIFYLI